MSYNDKKAPLDAPKIHKIRITLTSRKVQSLEKVCTELIDRAKGKDLRVKGPVRLPTKVLKISTRKTPNGEGSKTWDMFEMKIHKRLIDLAWGFIEDEAHGKERIGWQEERIADSNSLNAPTEVVKQIIINIEAGVEVEVTIAA
ncbi:40S ribosomal protein S20-like protein [Elsinoe fawcettii]|nr:40S ribosomal protein S20-like protein [Elsinoe fawcettii]